MNADAFARELKLLTPSVEHLGRLGMTSDGIEQFRQGFMCARTRPSNVADPLLDLCSNFDTSNVSIGSISFHSPKEFDLDSWEVGNDEENPLVLARTGDLITVRDYVNKNRKFAVCARSSAGFLAALVVSKGFLAECPFHPENRERGQARFATLDRCVSLAGGEECRKFYRNLLGISTAPAIWRILSQSIMKYKSDSR